MFQLSLASQPHRFRVFSPFLPSLGNHPHVGVYGECYDPFEPIILIELPPPSKDSAQLLDVSLCRTLHQRALLSTGCDRGRPGGHVDCKVDCGHDSGGATSAQDNVTTSKGKVRSTSNVDIDIDIDGGGDGGGTEPACEVRAFVIVHSQHRPAPCQKLMCTNEDEVNMMYHTWLWGDTHGADFSMEMELSTRVHMGIFEGAGVQPVHTDLEDSGVEFDRMGERSVIIHGGCFSPANAQLQLAPLDSEAAGCICSWAALAHHTETARAVLSWHVLPRSNATADAMRRAAGSSQTLRELLLHLRGEHQDSTAAFIERAVRACPRTTPRIHQG